MNDLLQLMSTDPLQLAKEPEKLDAIIAELRSGQRAFNLGNMKGGSTKASKTTAEQKSLLKELDTSVIDL